MKLLVGEYRDRCVSEGQGILVRYPDFYCQFITKYTGEKNSIPAILQHKPGVEQSDLVFPTMSYVDVDTEYHNALSVCRHTAISQLWVCWKQPRIMKEKACLNAMLPYV